MIAVVIVLWAPLSAHQDVLITRQSNGNLVELPDEYQPAFLIVEESSARSIGAVRIRLGNNQLNLPECLSVLFHKAITIDLSASWYHDPKSLPYYLSIKLPTKKPARKTYGYDGWSLLVALETAQVIRVSAKFQVHDGSGQRGQEIDLTTFCSADEREQLRPKALVDSAPPSN